MSFLRRIKSIFMKEEPQELVFEEAAKFKSFAHIFQIAIKGSANGKLSAFKWIVKEQQFAACYMIGFALVLAQSKPMSEQGNFALNIAFQIFKELFLLDDIDLEEDGKSKISEAFYHYLFAVDVHDDETAFEMGLEDGNKIIIEHMNLPRGLVAHFESRYK
jgi:hypothetical protein